MIRYIYIRTINREFLCLKRSWTTIKSWAKTVQATRGSNNPTYQLTSKGTYRSHITAVVWKDGKSEKVGASSEKKVY